MGQVERKLGQRVADRRRVLGLTQAELAERVGVAMETISRLERGTAVPGLARIEVIARALETELHDLLRFRDRPSKKEVAVEELVALLHARSEAEVRLVARVAADLLGHLDGAGGRPSGDT